MKESRIGASAEGERKSIVMDDKTRISLKQQDMSRRTLLNAGYVSVKQVFPSVPVMMHPGQPQKTTIVQNFFDNYKKYGGK